MHATDRCSNCHRFMGTHGGQTNDCPVRDESGLTPQLIGLEGMRVEVVDPPDGEFPGLTRRFYVGKSTGWRPCHLEIHNRRSTGGGPALKEYASVRTLYRR